MGHSNKTTLQAHFETGDQPTQAQFADMITSSINSEETAPQTIAGDFTFGVGMATASMAVSSSHSQVKFINLPSTAVQARELGTGSLFQSGAAVNNNGTGTACPSKAIHLFVG